MVRRFRGESHHKVDSKGRVSIPAQFRRVLETCDPNWQAGGNPELVIGYGDSRRGYLECYTIEAIEEVDAKITALPRGSGPRKTLERLFNRQSYQMSVDETGRLVLPAKLRDRIGLDGEAVFAGAGDTFQIWHPDAYDIETAESDAALEELPEDFDPLMYLDGITPDQLKG